MGSHRCAPDFLSSGHEFSDIKSSRRTHSLSATSFISLQFLISPLPGAFFFLPSHSFTLFALPVFSILDSLSCSLSGLLIFFPHQVLSSCSFSAPSFFILLYSFLSPLSLPVPILELLLEFFPLPIPPLHAPRHSFVKRAAPTRVVESGNVGRRDRRENDPVVSSFVRSDQKRWELR